MNRIQCILYQFAVKNGVLRKTALRSELVKPLFKRFKRFEKSLYGLKRLIFESELVLILKIFNLDNFNLKPLKMQSQF